MISFFFVHIRPFLLIDLENTEKILLLKKMTKNKVSKYLITSKITKRPFCMDWRFVPLGYSLRRNKLSCQGVECKAESRSLVFLAKFNSFPLRKTTAFNIKNYNLQFFLNLQRLFWFWPLVTSDSLLSGVTKFAASSSIEKNIGKTTMPLILARGMGCSLEEQYC